MTWGNFWLGMCGSSAECVGVSCVASSVTRHFTLSTPHFSNSQWGTGRQLNLLDVNMTHSVPGNKCGWSSTTAQQPNLDFDRRRACTGAAMGLTFYDRTVNLSDLMGYLLIILCSIIYNMRNAQSSSDSFFIEHCLFWMGNRVTNSPPDLSSLRSESLCSSYKAASASGCNCIHCIHLSFSKAYEKLFHPERLWAAEATTVLTENVFSFLYLINKTFIYHIISAKGTKQSVHVNKSFHFGNLSKKIKWENITALITAIPPCLCFDPKSIISILNQVLNQNN